MTLGEFITAYRNEHSLSKRAFADMVKMSTQQISNIEKGVGNNGKPMSSTMNTYKKISDGIGMEEQDFMKLLNDNVRVNPSHETEKYPPQESDGQMKTNSIILSDKDLRFVEWFHSLPQEKQKAILISQGAPEDLL